MTEKQKLWAWYKKIYNIDDRTLQSWRGKAQKYGVSLERYADFESHREQNQKNYELYSLSDSDIAFIFRANSISAGYEKLRVKRKEEEEKEKQRQAALKKKRIAIKKALLEVCKKYNAELSETDWDFDFGIKI